MRSPDLGSPGVGQKLRPFDRALIWSSVSTMLLIFMTSLRDLYIEVYVTLIHQCHCDVLMSSDVS